MRFVDIISLSLSNLFKRKLRTVLTVLGVVIGVTSILVMVALGFGLRESMLEGYSDSYSLTQIRVSQGYSNSSDEEAPMLSQDFINDMLSREHVTDVYPILTTDVYIKVGEYVSYAQLYGVTPEYFKTLKLESTQGDFSNDTDVVSLYYGNCVLQSFFVEKTYMYPYFENGEAADIDYFDDTIYVIYDMDAYYSSQDSTSGVAAPKKYITETSGVMASGIDEYVNECSYNVYCNIEALETQLKAVYKKKAIPGQPTQKNGKPYSELFYSSIIVQIDDMENVQALCDEINQMGYYAYSESEWIQQEMQTMNTVQLVLGAIGAVALLVAAIGITNTMMMSIYERTKEIGIMKVLGCDMHNIQSIFLTEAGFIGFLGGVVGVIFSYLMCFVINRLISTSGLGFEKICQIPVWLPPLAVVFAILIAMIAGFMPSLRAMKLSPLAAIRNE